MPTRACHSYLCSVARHQFGSTSGGSAVFLCPQGLAGVLAVCRRYSGLQGRDLGGTGAAGCRHNTPSGHATSRHRSHEWRPQNKQKQTDKPTAERILKAFSDISLTIIKTAAGDDILRRLTPLSGVQEDILQRLGLGATLYRQLEI